MPLQCCSDFPATAPGESPFRQIIGLGYYDGILSGLAKCHACEREFHFENLDENLGSGEVRIVSFASMPRGSMDAWIREVWHPKSAPPGIWVPNWTWPSEEVAKAKTSLSDRICKQASGPQWVVAWAIAKPMRVIRWLAFPNAKPVDWFAYCGLQRPTEN